MSRPVYDREREKRLDYEVFVDAYTKEEQALCWYYYLENKITFPFQARWGNEIVEVTDMDEDSEEAGSDLRQLDSARCKLNVLYREGDMEDIFPVLVTELEPVNADEKTQEAIADLRYWKETRGE